MKKQKKNVLINPKVKPDNGVDFAKLDNGDFFIYRGALWLKCERSGDQGGMDIATGRFEYELCEEIIEPVKVTINWEKMGD